MALNKAKNNLNRRRAFRINEQVDLFFHKIEFDQETEEKLDFNNVMDNVVQTLATNNPPSSTSSSFEQLLPDSQSKENDTLNVNISSSGISFTSKEKLMPGDYLIIRVLLLSSMTLIMTCSKVVYVKSSNPFEKNQYPNLVGAHFVNLKLEDKELINRHVNKKRNHLFILNGFFASIVMIVLVIPDLVFSLLIDLCVFLFDSFLGIIHLTYEFIEYGLDHLIENIFHTELHDTQIICFYILVFFGLIALYLLLCKIPSIYKNCYHRFRLFFYRKKSSFLYRWKEQTLLYKIGLISFGIIAILCYGLFYI